MPTSPISRRPDPASRRASRDRSRGLSLIELLVALAILGFLALTAALNAPATRSPEQDGAERLALQLRLSEAAAIASGQPARLVVTETGYRFETYAAPDWAPARFARAAPAATVYDASVAVLFDAPPPLADNEARLGGRPGDLDRRDKDDKDDIDDKGGGGGRVLFRISIDPAGMPAPFTAVFEGERGRWVVTRDVSGGVSVARG